MPEFRYKARDNSGAARSGVIDANNRSAAASMLRSRGLIVIGVDPVNQPTTPTKSNIDLSRFLPVRQVDIELSLQQLSMMIRGGMPLLTALVTLVEQAPRRSIARVWEKVIDSIQSGDSLSAALGEQRCFPEFVVQLVRVGERTGELAPVLHRSVETMRGRRRSLQEVAAALIYPVMVILVAIGVTVYMVVYLIPRLEVYLQNLDKEMPPMTQNLINVSVWLRQYYPLLIIIGFGLVVFALVAYRSREIRMWSDRMLFRIPIIGNLLQLCETSAFARSLSVMLGSGITLIDGLLTVEKLLFNQYSARSVTEARDKIIRGQNFSEAIGDSVAFSPMLKKMIAVGQQSGDLEGVLNEVADFHEDQFRSAIRTLNAILTPALTVTVGAVVGYVYIAFFVALLAAGN
ncbi:MAG: type II secretion system F family protein [Planctomycetota bacterium]